MTSKYKITRQNVIDAFPEMNSKMNKEELLAILEELKATVDHLETAIKQTL